MNELTEWLLICISIFLGIGFGYGWGYLQCLANCLKKIKEDNQK